MISRQGLIVAALVAAGIGLPNLAWAQSGQATVEKLVQAFTAWNGSPSDKHMYAEAAQYIDYTGMAERSLSGSEWSKLNATQKAQFTGTLRALIEQRYYVRWHKIFSKGKLTYLGESNSGADEIVKSELKLGKKTDPLNWRLANDKVISLAVGQNDLLNKLSTRLKGKLDKLGFNGLLAWMKNKANIRPDDSYEASTSTAQ